MDHEGEVDLSCRVGSFLARARSVAKIHQDAHVPYATLVPRSFGQTLCSARPTPTKRRADAPMRSMRSAQQHPLDAGVKPAAVVMLMAVVIAMAVWTHTRMRRTQRMATSAQTMAEATRAMA